MSIFFTINFIFGVLTLSPTCQVQYVSSAPNVISEGGEGGQAGSSGEIYFYQRHHREKMLARRDNR